MESDGFKAIAGGDGGADAADDALPSSPTKPSETVSLPAAPSKPRPKQANLASAAAAVTPAAGPAKLRNKTFAQVVAQSKRDGTPASSADVTSASEVGSDDDDDESDSDPQIDKPGGAAEEVSAAAAAAGADGDAGGAQNKKATPADERKPRKLVEDETRAVGKVSADVWKLYLGLMGGVGFWLAFVGTFGGAKLSDVAQTWWLGKWSGSCASLSSCPLRCSARIDPPSPHADEDPNGPAHSTNYYLALYSALSILAVLISTLQWCARFSCPRSALVDAADSRHFLVSVVATGSCCTPVHCAPVDACTRCSCTRSCAPPCAGSTARPSAASRCAPPLSLLSRYRTHWLTAPGLAEPLLQGPRGRRRVAARQLWPLAHVRPRRLDDARRHLDHVACVPAHVRRHRPRLPALCTPCHPSSPSCPLFADRPLPPFPSHPRLPSQARLFSHSAREFRRLDSVSKSPLFSIYGEAIQGVAVIRAFGSSARFMALMLERASTNVTFFYYLWCVRGPSQPH